MTPLFTWDARYKTGLAAIDRDHQRLLDLINRLWGLLGASPKSGPDGWEATCAELLSYASRHFGEEEGLMREQGVDPRHQQFHALQHRQLFQSLGDMAGTHGAHDPEGRQALARFLSHWFVAHVLGTDHLMARQVREIRAGQRPEAAYEALQDTTGAGALLEALQGLSESLALRTHHLSDLQRRLEAEVATRDRDLSLAHTALSGSQAELGAAREALQANEARYQAAVNASLDGFWIVDGEGRLREVNDTYAALSGYSREELLGLRIPDLEAVESPEETAAHIAQVLATGSDLFETRHRRKDGGIWPVEVLVSTTPADPGRFYVFLRDISRRKAVETALSASEHRYRHLFYDAPVGHALNRLQDGTFLAVNEAFAQITGYTLEELNRLSYWDLTPRSYEAQEALQLESLRSHGRYGPYEKEYIRKDGRHVPVLLNGTLIQDPDGTPLILSVVSDITENVRIRKLKDEFVSLVSHELRTPLTSIRGGVALALSGGLGELPPKVAEVLHIAHDNCDRLTRIINDLLDIQRIEQDLLELTVKPVALGPLLAQVVQEHAPFAALHKVRLDYLNDAGEAHIQSDPDRLSQVASNLISNAVKFSPEQGHVDIRLVRDGEGVALAVQDRGPGIPEAFHARVFEKFSQASEANIRHRGGSGLGLSIVKALVERLGGRVWFETEPDRGTTFHAWFPTEPSLGPGHTG